MGSGKLLTSQQDHFSALLAALPDEATSQVKAYLLAYDWNGSPEGASAMASTLAHKPEIIARVDELRKKHLVKLVKPMLQRWTEEAAAVTFYNPTSIMDEDGNVLPVSKWPDDVKRSIAGFDVEKRFEGKGENKVEYQVLKVRFVNKVQALEVLGRHLGAFVGADGIIPGLVNNGVMIFNLPAKRFTEGEWEGHYQQAVIPGESKRVEHKGNGKGNGST